jgi:hypothetical protein
VTAGIPGTGLSWTEYSPHSQQPSLPKPEASPRFVKPASCESALPLIQSAPVEQINQLSTSELAPILNSAQRRFRFAPGALVASICLALGALVSGNQLLIGLAALHTTVFVPWAVFLDRYRRSVHIQYSLDDTASQIADAISQAFADLKQCAFIWLISAKGGTSDWKRNAGASALIKRQRIYPRAKRPSCIRGSLSFPCITIGAEELYFLPDAMLVIKSNAVTALSYPDFSISWRQTRFIEDESAPRDTTVVGQTWQYLNKKGGPDRRFGSNRQLPICLYGEMAFESPGGLNGMLHCSNPSGGDRLAKVLEILRDLGPSLAASKSVKSFKRAKLGLSIFFWFCFSASLLAIGYVSAAHIQIPEHLMRSTLPVAPAPVTAPSIQKIQPVPKSAPKEKAARTEAPLPPPLVITPPLNSERQRETNPTQDFVPMPRPRPKATRSN